jgi:histone-lysine N-methyltransferase SETMAR
MFAEGRVDIFDAARSGCPSTASNAETIAEVNELIQGNRRIKVRDVVRTLDISIGTSHKIIHEDLGYRKVCARWVPRQLTPEHRQTRMGCSLNGLMRYQKDGHAFVMRIVAGDETCIHHFTPEWKRTSMEWKHPGSRMKKNFNATPSAGKVLMTVFWDARAILLIDFLERGNTINAARYCQTLEKLKSAVPHKRPGLLSAGVILLDDNARPHSAAQTQDKIAALRWERLARPPYGSDLAPSDFHLFPARKRELHGRRFQTDAEVQAAVTTVLKSLSPEFFAEGFDKLIQRWDKWLNVGGNYVEK